MVSLRIRSMVGNEYRKLNGELYKQEIVPQRYVYHISRKYNQKQILLKGLKASSSDIGYVNSVFAHNCDKLDLNWYPFQMDEPEWWYWLDNENLYLRLNSDSEFLRTMVNKFYDIWRIDTWKLKRKWFVDTIGERELGQYAYARSNLYIMSYGDIPTEAIDLCELTNKKLQVIEQHGHANVVRYINKIRTLRKPY